MGKATGKHPHQRLDDGAVRRAKQPGRYADGGGLYLEVEPTGSKHWLLRVTIKGAVAKVRQGADGKQAITYVRKDIGLGGLSVVSLAQAREKARAIRSAAREGRDPLAERRQTEAVPTFREIAVKVHEAHKPTWKNEKHAGQWLATLETYAFPIIGDRRVDGISQQDVLKVLGPIWLTKEETARRVRQRLGMVFDWAKSHGHRSGDSPMTGIEFGLPKQKGDVDHMAALPYGKVTAFVEKLRTSGADDLTKLCFEFMILTAARPGEARMARWDEIEWTDRLRVIPKERMKADVEHVIPLCDRAVEMLEAAKTLHRNGNDLVFPSRTGVPISDATLAKLARSLGFGHLTAHGFRSTFRDWASETTSFPSEVVEKALAHTIKSKVEAAYRRGDLLEKRRALMKAWASYACGETNVAPMRAVG